MIFMAKAVNTNGHVGSPEIVTTWIAHICFGIEIDRLVALDMRPRWATDPCRGYLLLDA
jgi:hypothetical protein